MRFFVALEEGHGTQLGMCRVSWLIPLSVAVLVAGCAKPLPQVGGKLRTKRYDAIVSLSPGTTEFISQYGPYGVLKGRTAADDFPAASLKSVPIVGDTKPDYEKLKAMKADFIVYDAALYNEQDIQQLKSKVGAETYAIDAKTLDEFEKQLYGVVNKIGGETNMSGYVDKIEAARAAASGDAINPKPSVALLIPGKGGEHYIAGTDTLQADLLKIAGGTPVGPKADRFVPINVEQLVSMNPDFLILAVDKDPKTATVEANSILNDPRLKTIKAIQTRHIAALDSEVALRRGSRIVEFISNSHRALAMKAPK